MKVCMVLHKYGVPLDDPCCYPIGYMLVAAYFKRLGHDVKVLNYNLFNYSLEEEIKGQDLVTFTGFEEFRNLIIQDAGICRRHGVKTLIGGALATFRPKECKEYADYVHTGYIDHTGLMPDYEAFGIAEYHRRHGKRYMGVLASYGCPYHCTFCSHTGQFLPRSVDDVMGEVLEYAMRYNVELIVFNDNTFNFSKKRYMEICRKISFLGVKWCAAIRADIFDEQMAIAAAASGCEYFIVGVESFRQAKLDRMHKELKAEAIINCLDLLHKYGIKYHGNVLVGFDGETLEDIRKEISEIPPQYNVFPTLVQPFIGTKDGYRRSMSKEEINELSEELLAKVVAKGYYQYPAVEWP